MARVHDWAILLLYACIAGSAFLFTHRASSGHNKLRPCTLTAAPAGGGAWSPAPGSGGRPSGPASTSYRRT